MEAHFLIGVLGATILHGMGTIPKLGNRIRIIVVLTDFGPKSSAA